MPDDPRNPGGESSGGFSPSMRIGGIPAWGWLAGAAVVAGIWFYSRKKADETAPPTTNTVTVPGVDATDVQGQLATLNAQIRDLQGTGSVPTPTPNGDSISLGPLVRLPEPKATTGPHNSGPIPAGARLEDYALRYWGDASLARWLYWVNQDLIESAAKKAGYPDSNGGATLIPGINLNIPPKPTVEHVYSGNV